MNENNTLLRKEVVRFSHLMENQLRENDHKGGWSECTVSYLWSRLIEELNELKIAVFDGRGDIALEAADVANFAMMLVDNLTSDNNAKNGSDNADYPK